MKQLFFVLVFFCAFSSFAQSKEFKISGSVFTEVENFPLESATIYLERIKDSSLVTYTISDKNGKFTLEGKSYDKNVNLFISHVGYQTYKQNVNLNKVSINLEAITLQTDANALDEVLITSRAPITVKKDTLEFNVKSFKTKKDANIEDLLKQLPGVEVDEEGKITVNGKEVNKILVNGKPFFGSDPTITTRNFAKELIDKVQITDTKSKAEAFAGEEGDKENKTINLTINKDKNKGVFGRLAAGAGTDKRYEFAGMMNIFDNEQRISLLAGGNNTNSPSFSFGEISKCLVEGVVCHLTVMVLSVLMGDHLAVDKESPRLKTMGLIMLMKLERILMYLPIIFIQEVIQKMRLQLNERIFFQTLGIIPALIQAHIMKEIITAQIWNLR